ncbi:zinc finger, CCHC-type containing protein [Tanacetum coccineum]
MRLFQFSLRDQASHWLERLPAGSISTWEDLTTHFLAQFFPLRRTAKLRNDILIGPHDIQYCIKNPEQAFVDYASSRNNKVGGDSMAYVNAASTDHIEKEELRSKGIKSPSKLLSLKYLSQASLEE